MSQNKRPDFRTTPKASPHTSPEELFSKLAGRADSHGYLRAPQVDAIREYVDHCDVNRDIALELPTGTGKTVVGLLIAEWRRRKSGHRAAYLALTNQLAKQVITEAARLGIEVADLRGSRETRDPTHVGRYQSGKAVAVTTYSNLFNINPVIQESDTIVFDDAHGGESFVNSMWEVEISSAHHPKLYGALLTSLRPCLSDAQYSQISTPTGSTRVALADRFIEPTAFGRVSDILDADNLPSALHYPWQSVRQHSHACFIFVSSAAISIRPLIPPTHTHAPFAQSSQRIYMSATLSGSSDLQRAYGLDRIQMIHAGQAQWGLRYIFAPELCLTESDTDVFLERVWQSTPCKRALVLSPSFKQSDHAVSRLDSAFGTSPNVLDATDVEESLDSFATQSNALLALSGRYDGLDLPGERCRLLILHESPAAIGNLERHQIDHWKLGPLLRRRERTRLLQGLGRCTRDATDYAVVVLLGASVLNSITTPAIRDALPSEVGREIAWGIEQGEIGRSKPEAFAELVAGLFEDSTYRLSATESIQDAPLPQPDEHDYEFENAASSEVAFAKSLWDGAFGEALRIARSTADSVSGDVLAGYRAWWLYLASCVADALTERETADDCLERARATGINVGFLDYVARSRAGDPRPVPDNSYNQIEQIWAVIQEWGFHGPKHSDRLSECDRWLHQPDHPTKFHMGLERLGYALGADTIRSTEGGAPDCVWVFEGLSFTFEAKSDKAGTSQISKKEILQANGHPEWLIAERPSLAHSRIVPVMVSGTTSLNEYALPHVGDLRILTIDEIQQFGSNAIHVISDIRSRFSGRDYSEALPDLYRLLMTKRILASHFSEWVDEKR